MQKKIAYLGIQGSYSEQAAHHHFGDDIIDIECQTFSQIFDLLETGGADHGILPIENSLAGTVSQSYELLTENNLKIQGEVILKIEHALMVIPGVTLEDIKRVRSHPQALAQCAQFLKQHQLQPVNWYNTAGAAKDLAEEGHRDVAAIASPIAAELYGLEILLHNVQDIPQNYTRFFVLGKQDIQASTRNKTSLVFTTRHMPGALVGCLLSFSERGINLTKIESRPIRDRPWEYIFYLDFEGHAEDEAFQSALEMLRQHTAYVRVLGSYPAADTPR